MGTFQNDDAADWAYELEDAPDLSPVRQALAATMDSDGYLELPEGARALAAAAVLAATFDGVLKGLPEEVAEWVDRHPGEASNGDARLAADALDRVLSEDSELRILWDDTPQGPDWVAAVQTLQQRVAGAIGEQPGVG